MKPRTLSQTIEKARKTFPAIVITGPRQSGKTTLLHMLFEKNYSYVNLENPDVRMRANADPNGFLSQYKPPLIIDEIQYVPTLLSYIKTAIDKDRKPGQWLITGSQNFALMQNVSQSLSGRAAVFSLLPFSLMERCGLGDKAVSIDSLVSKGIGIQKETELPDLAEIILRGNYPEIASNKKVDRQILCGSYITTYLERDIRNLKQVGDLSQFEIFLRACAVRTGQILNLSGISRDIGVSFSTAKRWLSLLETGYQVYLLYPYYRNIGKRTIKSPKLYFTDTGLASYLLGLHKKESLIGSPHYGNLFETLVVTDFLKRSLNFGQIPSLYYLKTRDGLEVDLVIEVAGKLCLFEVKSSSTITEKHAVSLIQAAKDVKEVEKTAIISTSEDSFVLGKGVRNYKWQDILVT